MSDFTITFDRPWLLLLLIPAVAFTLITYFLLPKRYRKTRNRIVSMVLHTIVMVLCISVLSGIKFEYRVPNLENEIILLVDVSDTSEESKDLREDFMRTVISESRYKGCKIGVVTFGFTQVYAAPLTYDTESVFSEYENAPLPDTSATDIAAALNYASTFFSYPQSAKIVLISDGKETDESAATDIGKISARGIKIDTVFMDSGFSDDNVQVIGVEYPDYHVNLNEDCIVNVTVNSKSDARATVIKLFDNGESDTATDEITVDVPSGTMIYPFTRKFKEEGLHKIRIEVTTAKEDDGLTQNNVYYSYFNLEVYDNVLLVDRGKVDGESDKIKALLEDKIGENDLEYKVSELHLQSSSRLPTTAEELLDYDQIILNNISNEDLEDCGMIDAVYDYVNVYGGGLFTVGGNDEKGEAHAYNRQDLLGSKLQQMLPVQAINYTPPVGVVFLIDASGSMKGEKLDSAKSAAKYSLEALSSRDYVGVVSLSDTYQTEIQLTSRIEETAIKEAIDAIAIRGSTNYGNAIKRAAQALIAEKRINKRHIIIITDGQPTELSENYLPQVSQYYRNNGITFSAIGIELSNDGALGEIVKYGGGKLSRTSGQAEIMEALYSELQAPPIPESKDDKFHPAVMNKLSQTLAGVEYGTVQDTNAAGEVVKETANALTATLSGYYGAKARDKADVILMGDYEVPIYVQWKFGAGMVGSFMCDLSGNWSDDFLKDKTAQRFLKNVVLNLMPTEDIHPTAIRMTLEEDNYINHLRLYPSLGEGEYLEGTITDGQGLEVKLEELAENTEGADVYVTGHLNADTHYSSCTFVVKKSGTYKITVVKKAADGSELARTEIYKSFSYSEEYAGDPEVTELSPSALMANLAGKGNGETVAADDPWSVFLGFVTGNDVVYDPALVFMIIAAICFLADVAVRKFKFKWPHEIIRSIKEKRAAQTE